MPKTRFGHRPWVQRLKRRARQLIGREPWIAVERDASLREMGGWQVADAYVPNGAIVYGVGVGQNIDFELAVINAFGAHVFTFDPTPESARWLAGRALPATFHFEPSAVADHDGPVEMFEHKRPSRAGNVPMLRLRSGAAGDGDTPGTVRAPAFRLASLMSRYGHPRIDLLRLDVEGAEYTVLADMCASSVRPRQLLVEFHHRFADIGTGATRAAVAGLRACGYRVVALSPTGREITFVHDP